MLRVVAASHRSNNFISGLYPACIVDTDKRAEAFEKTYHLITSCVDDIEFSRFANGFFASRYFEPSIHFYYRIVNLWIQRENVNLLFSNWGISPIPMPMALRILWISDPTTHELWKQAIRDVLSLSVDLHAILRYGDGRVIILLCHILDRAEQPFEPMSLGHKWLEILSESGLDIVKYLEVESEIYCNSFQTLPMMARLYDTGDRDQYLIISKEPPIISWEWYIDPAGRAFDVLHKFRDLGIGPQDMAECLRAGTFEGKTEGANTKFFTSLLY